MVSSSLSFAMNNQFRSWNVACWNVRDMNADAKILSIRQKMRRVVVMFSLLAGN